MSQVNSPKNDMRPEYYEAILERLKKDFNLTVDRTEHPGITEFLEGPLPLFKLILAAQDDATNVMLVSFQIQLDTPAAIQWFARLRQLDPQLLVTACYIKDADGTSYVGEDAEIMLMYMVEQDVISAWVQSNKDAEEVLNQELPSPPPSPAKQYTDYRRALIDFQKMAKKKGDVSH